MRVRYQDINQTVPDDVNPDVVFNTLKQTFSELVNGSYSIVTEGGERVMQVYLRSGSKAAISA